MINQPKVGKELAIPSKPRNGYKSVRKTWRNRPPQSQFFVTISFTDSLISLRKKYGANIAAMFRVYCKLYDQLSKDNPKLNRVECTQLLDFILEINGIGGEDRQCD